MDSGEFPIDPVQKIPQLHNSRFDTLTMTETHQAILQYFRERGKKSSSSAKATEEKSANDEKFKATLSEVAEGTGLPHEDVHRYIADLHGAGHLERSGDHFWLA